MTTPGGVPNLPVGALTLETLASNLQDMSGSAMKARAVERFPSIMDGSTGLSAASDITPFGILTRIYSEVTASVANADPADIQGPDDIPGLLLEFIEGIPVVGQFVQLIKAILGTYDGPDPILQTIQAIFDPIRKFFQMITGIFTGFPTISQVELAQFPQHMVEGLTYGLGQLGAGIQGAINGIVNGLLGLTGAYWTQDQADEALRNQAANTAAIAAAVAMLQGRNNQENSGGINLFVDFSVLPDSLHLPAAFVETYTGGVQGTYGVRSGFALVTTDEAPYTGRSVIGEFDGDTVTDYQRVGGVWAGKPVVSYQNPTPFFTPVPYYNPYGAEHVIYCRYKDALNWVRVRFTADGVNFPPVAILECAVAGTVTELRREGHGFSPNTAYWIEAGTAGGPRIFRVMQGNVPVLVFSDTLSVTQMGAAYRGGGVGAMFSGPAGAGWAASPAGLIYCTLQDNSPNNAYLGKQARWFRSFSGGPFAPVGGGMVENGFFDTADYNVGQVFTMDNSATSASQNCRITVSEKCLVEVTARFNLNGSGAVIGYLWKNGQLIKRGGSGPYESQSVWTVNCAAGDYLNVGVAAPNGYQFMGDTSGAFCYVEIRQLISAN